MTEENANMTLMVSATSVAVLLQILTEKADFVNKAININEVFEVFFHSFADCKLNDAILILFVI